jgi:hypothetical protein
MMVKRCMVLALAGIVFVPPAASPAIPLAVLTGVVTSLKGSPLTQVDLDLVNLDNGKVTPMRTDGLGAFRTAVEPGLYTVDAGRSGYKVARGPRLVSLASGRAETAEIVLASLQTSDQEQTDDRDRKGAALLLPPSRSGGFFGSKAGILTLSALGVGSIVTIVVLTRNDKDDKPNASPSR